MKSKKLTIVLGLSLGLAAAAFGQSTQTNQWVTTPYESAAFAACKDPTAIPLNSQLILSSGIVTAKRHFCESPSGHLISFVCRQATQSCDTPQQETKSVSVFTAEVAALREQMRQEAWARMGTKAP